MKPHSMFFDECYNELYYRSNTITKFYKDCDLLIVVGTTLETGFASTIVEKTLYREVPVIEINLQPLIAMGNTYRLV